MDTRNAIQKQAAKVATEGDALEWLEAGWEMRWWPTNPQATRMSKAHIWYGDKALCGARPGYGELAVGRSELEAGLAEVCSRCRRSMV